MSVALCYAKTMYRDKPCRNCETIFSPSHSRSKFCPGCLTVSCRRCGGVFIREAIKTIFCSLKCRSAHRFRDAQIRTRCEFCDTAVFRTRSMHLCGFFGDPLTRSINRGRVAPVPGAHRLPFLAKPPSAARSPRCAQRQPWSPTRASVRRSARPAGSSSCSQARHPAPGLAGPTRRGIRRRSSRGSAANRGGAPMRPGGRG